MATVERFVGFALPAGAGEEVAEGGPVGLVAQHALVPGERGHGQLGRRRRPRLRPARRRGSAPTTGEWVRCSRCVVERDDGRPGVGAGQPAGGVGGLDRGLELVAAGGAASAGVAQQAFGEARAARVSHRPVSWLSSGT